MELQFSDWVRWRDRGMLPTYAGIYIIAKGASDNIIYIGCTLSNKGLRGRVRLFNRCAVNGQGNHAGGVTYHRKFGAHVDDLFVTFHVPDLSLRDEPLLGAYIQYVERRLIWEHAELHGALPACNSK